MDKDMDASHHSSVPSRDCDVVVVDQPSRSIWQAIGLGGENTQSEAAEDAVLAALGYKHELKREMGMFTNFAVSFTIISILTGVSGLYGLGFTYGGPVVLIWGWLMCCVLTLSVACSMGEICSAFPTTGDVYYWSYALAGRHRAVASWLTGWLNLTGQVAVTAGIVYTFATTLGQMINLSLPEGSTFLATEPRMLLLYYFVVLVLSGLINSFDVKVVSLLDGISVVWHIAGTVIYMIILLAVAPTHQPASYVFGQFNDADGTGVESPVYVFFLGLLMTQFTLLGYDASAKMSEETVSASRAAPWGIIHSVTVSAVVGFGYLLAITFSIQDPSTLLDPTNATGGTFVMGQVVLDAFAARGLPRSSAVALLTIPLIAQFFCGVSSITANGRTLYAFARDKAVPGYKFLAIVSSSSRTPVAATWMMVFLAFVLGLPMLGSTVAFTAITSLATIGLYVSYALPIFFRVTVSRKTFKPGPVNLGRFGVPVGIVAVLWVAFMTVLFVLPTAYPVTPVNLNYAGVMLGGVLAIIMGWWLLDARRWFDGPETVRQGGNGGRLVYSKEPSGIQETPDA